VSSRTIWMTWDTNDHFRQIDRLVSGTDEVALLTARAAAEEVLEIVRENIRANFTIRTGKLLNNWEIVQEVKGGRHRRRGETELRTDTIYARIHEFGGVITPKRAKMLSWIDPDTGWVIFARRVVIPARPYFRPAMQKTGRVSRAASRAYEAWLEDKPHLSDIVRYPVDVYNTNVRV
jgi:phage gpG-like protein